MPIVYNTSSYEEPEVIRLLAGWIDIYLPDFKFGDEQVASELSRAGDYVRIATASSKR